MWGTAILCICLAILFGWWSIPMIWIVLIWVGLVAEHRNHEWSKKWEETDKNSTNKIDEWS